ncbi:hypothetical protein CLOP_g11344 [Closterium sp. NIES-67]|nr:hypothetical protein CLOP_g11344 [Closterium sp. NIES-67]
MGRFNPQHSSELARRCVFSDLLGEGQSGRVWRCEDRATGEAFACKQVRKDGLSPAAEADLQREITLLIILQGHPNMLRLVGLYEDAKAVYILTELCDGGDLFGLIAANPRGLDERAAARIFAQLARGVQWCHDHRVVHRDIKPENILISRRRTRSSAASDLSAEPSAESPSSSADAMSPPAPSASAEYDVRVGDFGLAYQLPRDKAIVGLAGSAPYEAPEVLARAPYGCEADVWSLGVLLYALLSASWPSFRAGERKLVPLEDFGYWPWRKDGGTDGRKGEESRAGVSWAAKDLICRMMTVDPQDRIDIDGVLSHPWLVQHSKVRSHAAAAAPVAEAREDTAVTTAHDLPEMEAYETGACHEDQQAKSQATAELSAQEARDVEDVKAGRKMAASESGASGVTSISSMSISSIGSSCIASSSSRSSSTRSSSTTPTSHSSSSYAGRMTIRAFSSCS